MKKLRYFTVITNEFKENKPKNSEEEILAAQQAGWNPDDGPAPLDHGMFVKGLDIRDTPPRVSNA